jgi:hypothetical protein
MMAIEMIPRATRKKRTPEDIKAEMAKLESELLKIEQEQYADQLLTLLEDHQVANAIHKIKASISVDDITVLYAIGKAMKVPRLQITQKERQTRAKRTKKQMA